MGNRMLYKILIFDDDPLSLQTEENAIYDVVGSSKDYDIYVEKSTSSRDVLDLAEDNTFDIFILDVCIEKAKENLLMIILIIRDKIYMIIYLISIQS